MTYSPLTTSPNNSGIPDLSLKAFQDTTMAPTNLLLRKVKIEAANSRYESDQADTIGRATLIPGDYCVTNIDHASLIFAHK